MAVDSAVVNVILNYGARTREVRAKVLDFIRRSWGSLDSWREADIARFVDQVVPVVTGGQLQTAALTDSYLATVQSAMTGLPVRPVGIPASLVTDDALRGVPAAEVYARTGPTVWRSLSEGNSLSDAVGSGLARALNMGATDLQLSKTHSSRYVTSRNDRIVGTRRVLSGSASCGLCIVASTQRYKSYELMPIHPGCSCDTAPIMGSEDPGQVIDPDTLDDLHAAIADRFGDFSSSARASGDVPNYRDVMVVHNHGEIGPVLSVRGQKFTGPADL